MPGLALTPTGETFEKVKGPAFAFVKVASVAAGANMTLALDPTGTFKTPDATQNPNGFALGCTNDGWKLTSAFEEEEEFCDESTVAEFSAITKETYNLEVSLRNPLNSKIMSDVFGMTVVDGSGFKRAEGGGFSAVPTMTLAIVVRNPADPTKYGYLLYHKVQLVSAFNLDQITSKKSAAAVTRFKALADTTRPLGRQVYQIWYEE